MQQPSLQEFVESVNGTSHLRVEYDYGDGFVRLQTSEAERRQAAQDIQCSEHIVLELLRNSRDAHASHVFVAFSREDDKRVFTVIDDGDGIPESMHSHIFESRVTSKLDSSHMDAWGLHGRGMALYSISVNADSAEVANSAPGLGTSICVVSDTSKLPERADQSTFPSFEMTEMGKVKVRGPRNILRTICEFAIECRGTCSVYVGSSAEICAGLYQYGSSRLSAVERLFCDNADELVITKRLATASSPRDFADLAATMGLSISERTARRIIDGEISSPKCMLDRIEISSSLNSQGESRKNASSGQRRVHLTHDEKALISDAVKDAYRTIAQKYYLNPDMEATVKTTRDRIIISLPIVEESQI